MNPLHNEMYPRHEKMNPDVRNRLICTGRGGFMYFMFNEMNPPQWKMNPKPKMMNQAQIMGLFGTYSFIVVRDSFDIVADTFRKTNC
jgi:hypothetical protein